MRDLTQKGLSLFQDPVFDPNKFGNLLNLQQDILRENFHVSTSKIDRMVDTACRAGALGAKINGSGEGGCIFAYSPGTSMKVAEALGQLDTDTFIVNIDKGVCRDSENYKGEIS